MITFICNPHNHEADVEVYELPLFEIEHHKNETDISDNDLGQSLIELEEFDVLN